MNLLGTKKGPANSQITFAVDGFDNGVVHVTAMVDNQMVLSAQTITVGNGMTTTTPAPATTTTTVLTTPTPTPTAQPTDTTTLAEVSPTTTGQPTDTTTLAEVSPTTTGQPSETAAAAASPVSVTPVVTPQTFTSADQKVSLTASGVDYAGLMMVTATGVPDTWLSVYDPYTIAPDTLTFSPPATISFAIPAPASPGTSYAYFIGEYNNGQWTAVPSTPGYGSIDAEIDQAGTYGLMAFKPESTIQPTVTGTGQEATPTPLVQETSYTEDRVDRAGRFPVRCPDKGTPRQHGRDRGACDRPRALRADAAVIARWGKPPLRSDNHIFQQPEYNPEPGCSHDHHHSWHTAGDHQDGAGDPCLP